MSIDRHTIKAQRKRKRRKRLVLWVFTPMIVLMLAAASYGAFLYNKAESVMGKSYNPLERDTKRQNKVHPKVDNISILFVGIDDSESRKFKEGSRTDALMLATFNEKQKSVKLLSIPRDSYVYIPSKGYEDKINHAYGKGGVESTIETVEELIDIPVDYYVKMNFDAFIDVVDALGGIEAEVPYTLYEKDSEDHHNAIHLEPGTQELNGEEALALARTRKQDNDIERGKRQQQILKAIMSKATSVKSVTKYADVIEAVGDNMETSLSFSEMKSFIDYATAGTNLNIETLNLAGQDSMIDGVYYYQLDQEALDLTKQTIKAHLSHTGTSTAAKENSESQPDSEEESSGN